MSGDGRGFPPGHIRVSDAERDQALSELTEAFQAGRLTAEEFGQRSDLALNARTGSELTVLFTDLPPGNLPMTPAAATAPAVAESANRAVTVRAVMAASGVAAVVLFGKAATTALSSTFQPNLTAAQRAWIHSVAAQHGLSVTIPANSPGIDWAGVLAPAGAAVLLVLLIIVLHVIRVRRLSR